MEYLRQRKYAPNASMFLYFWSDPWPCLCGSGLLDYHRRKYKAYDVFGTVYSPVLVSIEWIKDQHHVGFQKSYEAGEQLVARIWITNDTYQSFENASLSWRVLGPDGETLDERTRQVSIGEDSSEVVEEVAWPIPEAATGGHRMEAEVTDASGKVLSRNWFEFAVVKPGVKAV